MGEGARGDRGPATERATPGASGENIETRSLAL
jgi:hypothetical protein